MINELLAKERLTEEEFLEIINTGLQSELKLNTEITLPNPLGTTDVWVVADVNHDGTIGTVDLVSKNLICDSTHAAYGDYFGVTQNYFGSKLYKWLNDVFINGFSRDIQSKLKVMDVKLDVDGIIEGSEDKIKLLSMNELGYTNSDWVGIPTTVEDTRYPIFEKGDGFSARTKRKKYKANGSTAGWYWTRSHHIIYSDYVWFINSDGSYSNSIYMVTTGGVVAAVRF